MIPKDFDAIKNADIEALVSNAVAERRTIEYKQQLPSLGDEEKKEFLADISSFANAAGGDIIYGVTEQRDENGKPTGIPAQALGLADINADETKRRLEEIIRTGIDPRIPGIRIEHFDGFPTGPIILIRIPRSWVSPHMVIFKNHSRFFTRDSAGKHQLDVRELRSAFTASGDLNSKITAFRNERLGKILANEGPVSLPGGPKLILHLLPLAILNPNVQVDLAPLMQDPNLAPLIHGYSSSVRINLDGYLSFSENAGRKQLSGYTQVFRSGAFEAVDMDIFKQVEDTKQIASISLGKLLNNATSRYINTAKKLGVPLPIVVMVASFGLKGYAIASNSPWPNEAPTHQIDRNSMLLPDVLLEDYATPVDILLHPILDALWQSAGFPACENYNEKGRWDGGMSLKPGYRGT